MNSLVSWGWESIYPAPAKLNLFLHVVGRRADGYHLLQTLFRFVDHGDRLHFSPRHDGELRLSKPLPGVLPEDDLTLRAARLLQEQTGCRQGVEICVEKRLPMGGGLGGGSSDAATVLLALNHLWQLGLSRQRLQEIGLSLGADVPVFLFGRNAFAEALAPEVGVFRALVVGLDLGRGRGESAHVKLAAFHSLPRAASCPLLPRSLLPPVNPASPCGRPCMCRAVWRR